MVNYYDDFEPVVGKVDDMGEFVAVELPSGEFVAQNDFTQQQNREGLVGSWDGTYTETCTVSASFRPVNVDFTDPNTEKWAVIQIMSQGPGSCGRLFPCCDCACPPQPRGHQSSCAD
jgi:hypothetical protein